MKKNFFLLIIVVLVVTGGCMHIKNKKLAPCKKVLEDNPQLRELPRFTSEELQMYDGVQNENIYLGYHCIVYDVSGGKEIYYGVDKPYHYLVARDSTKQLEIFGGDIIESKYPKVGVLME